MVHKNNVTVDNRLDNLELVKDDCTVLQQQDESSGAHSKNRENSLYWITVTQLLGDPLEMVLLFFFKNQYNLFYKAQNQAYVCPE